MKLRQVLEDDRQRVPRLLERLAVLREVRETIERHYRRSGQQVAIGELLDEIDADITATVNHLHDLGCLV